MAIQLKKINTTAAGIFTVKEYLLERIPDFPFLVKCLEAGPGEVQEVITYVFEGDDPLEADTKSFTVEEFSRIYPKMKACGYGAGLAIDVVVQIDGHPATVELTEGSNVIAVNSLDRDLEIEILFGRAMSAEGQGTEELPGGGMSSEGLEPKELPGGGISSKDPEPKALPGGAISAEDRGPETLPAGEHAEEDELTPVKLLEILSVAERLKCNTRHCDTSSGRRESVAEHSWRIALLAMLLSGVKEFAGTDMNRVIRMCLIHDLGEAFTGDIPTFEKTTADEAGEEQVLDRWIDGFPGALKNEFRTLLDEMKELKTPEAKLFKALDKIEAVIQHNESDISSWLPLEYDLQLSYGREEMQFSPFLRALRECVDSWTREKIENSIRKK